MAFTVKTAGRADVAERGDVATVPAVQLREICTVEALAGEKTLLTVKVPLPGTTLRVFVMVQLAVPPAARATLVHVAWLAV